jgi:hypothetical protein
MICEIVGYLGEGTFNRKTHLLGRFTIVCPTFSPVIAY